MNDNVPTQPSSIPASVPALMDLSQAAKVSGISCRTLTAACRKGKLPAQEYQMGNGKSQYIVRIEDLQSFASAEHLTDTPREVSKEQAPVGGTLPHTTVESLSCNAGQGTFVGEALPPKDASTIPSETDRETVGKASPGDETVPLPTAVKKFDPAEAVLPCSPRAGFPGETHDAMRGPRANESISETPKGGNLQIPTNIANPHNSQRPSEHPSKGLVRHIKNSLRRCNQEELAAVAAFILLRMTRQGGRGTNAQNTGLDA